MIKLNKFPVPVRFR